MRSLRAVAILCLLSAISIPAFAETPTAVLEAVVQANRLLGKGYAGEAVKVLERHLADANGDQAFNDTLKAAYTAQLKELTDPAAVEGVRGKLATLSGNGALPLPVLPGDAEPEPAKPQQCDLLKQAVAIFNNATNMEPGQYLTARDLFWKAFNNKVQMNADQTAAWAYCRVKVAADKFNKSNDVATAEEVVKEVTDALATVPDNVQLNEAGKELLAAARKRTSVPETSASPAMETDNYIVHFTGNKALAESVARLAEAKRTEIFTRWSGPPGGKWSPKCEIVLHESAEAFAKATKLAPTATGCANATLAEGRVTARRIDLRADDASVLENALPRELTHIILADLFPSQPPPRWAELGMAVLASSEAEVNRYLQTVPRVATAQNWLSVAKLTGAADVPAANVTAFHVESVSLVEFLVRWQGEKAFTAFLRDAQRYGVEPGFKRQYGLKDFNQLEREWKKNVLGE